MQYNDIRIQYDQSNVLYDGSWTLTISETASFSESITKYLRIAIAEIATISEALGLSKVTKLVIEETIAITETLAIKLGIAIAEISSISESFNTTIGKIISETSTITESITKSIMANITEISTISESFGANIKTVISEAITISEIVATAMKTVISEVSTFTETKVFTFRMVVNDIAQWEEEIVRNVYERLKGVIGIIKEFVRIGDKKEKASAINLSEGVREQYNEIELQYDHANIVYDQAGMCYNNYIASEKPKFVLSKINSNATISFKKDKPSISKK